MTRFSFLVFDAFFHPRLSGDAGVIGARHPKSVEALHAFEPDHDVLQRIVERVAQMQGTGDVGWRDDDRIGLLLGIGLSMKPAAGHPVGIDFFLGSFEIETARDVSRIRGCFGFGCHQAFDLLCRREFGIKGVLSTAHFIKETVQYPNRGFKRTSNLARIRTQLLVDFGFHSTGASMQEINHREHRGSQRTGSE